jgi:hypothetical protein
VCQATDTSAVLSAGSVAVDSFVRKALEQRLDTSHTWIALGRWTKSGTDWKNGVDGGYFYLAPDGATNPAHELVATIRALASDSDRSAYAHDTTPIAMHPRVKFRPRARFLREAGMPDSLFALVDTSRWMRWEGGVRPKRATLVYASSYLGNPASMFGHVLLRFDAGDRDGLRDRLNYGITYGAAMPPGDPLYAFKGLFGLYPGFHTILPYYMSLQKYKYLESRDLWEYPLDLDSVQVQRLLEIVWEGGAAWNRYYFFTENCATGLARLLDVLQPDSGWSRSFPSPSMPPEMVRLLRDRGLAGEPVRRPSQLAIFLERRDRLSDSQRGILREVADGSLSDLRLDDSSSRAEVLDAAIDYAGWRRREAPKDSVWRRRLDSLLLRRATLSIPPVEVLGAAGAKSPPETGHHPRLLGAWTRIENEPGALRLGLTGRVVYHSLEERPAGYLDGSEVEAGVVDASWDHRFKPDGFRLHRFEVLRIRSVPLWDSWLRPWAWILRFAARPFGLESMPWADAEFGRGMAFGVPSARVWATICARAALAPWERLDNATVGPQAIGGILLSSNPATLGLDASWFEGWPIRKREFVGNATLRISLTRDLDLDVRGGFDLRNGLDRDSKAQARAGLGWHL